MNKIFFSEYKNFSFQFDRFLKKRSESNSEIGDLVKKIIDDVKTKGDSALVRYTKKFDQLDLNKAGFFYTKPELLEGKKSCDLQDRKAVDLAIERITNYHEKQLPKNILWQDKLGIDLGWVWKPINRIGVYVPGGKASYPSSAIMNIIPAKVAGVNDIILTSPSPKGYFNPLLLYSAIAMNVHDILRLGGAQAIAALAYGTEKVKPVNKVTGPGNEYVAEAKRQVFGKVGIDSVAGPSEVLLICDNTMPPELAAIDLLAQAEHDEKAQAILITDSEKYAYSVMQELERYLNKLKRKRIAETSWKNFGAVVIVPSFRRAIELSNLIAPEHLQLCFADMDKYLEQITNAGSVFMGCWSPEAMGDYISGSNHVLPTVGTAKFSSSLSVFDFMKRISITKLNREGFQKLAPYVIRLANSEGLESHSLSISERLKDFK